MSARARSSSAGTGGRVIASQVSVSTAPGLRHVVYFLKVSHGVVVCGPKSPSINSLVRFSKPFAVSPTPQKFETILKNPVYTRSPEVYPKLTSLNVLRCWAGASGPDSNSNCCIWLSSFRLAQLLIPPV